MQYVRKLDIDSLAKDRFDFVTLADLETCWVVAVRVPPGYEGPAPHVHDRDQIYYVIEGEMNVMLGDDEHDIGPDTLVFISEGTPHQNRNRGSEPEVHLDLLVPPPPRGRPPARSAEPTDVAPGTAYVRHVGEDDYTPSHIVGFDMARIANPGTGSHGIMVNAARVDAASPGTTWHIHKFDQLYWVLEGTLSVDVADQHHDVGPGHLVVLPAGVPHRNWNEGPELERHVAFLVPAPTEPPFDTGVKFVVGGEV